jgi:hypothetical protein
VAGECEGGMSDRLIELERKEARRETIDRIAAFLENYETNELYHKALVMAANLLRAGKHEKTTD